MSNKRKTYRLSMALLLTLLAELVLAALWVLGNFVFLQTIPGIQLERPEWMWLFATGPIFTVLFLLFYWWKGRALESFSSPDMIRQLAPMISKGKPILRFVLFRFAVFFLTIALINPKIGSKMVESKQEGIDILIAIDVSSSMLAEDIKPNRLERAKRGISQMVDDLYGDRVGIIVFAGDAYVQLPITTDYSAARMFLKTITPDVVPVQGTSIGAAIDLAIESFDYDNGAQKAIIVISDGEDHEAAAIAAAEKAREKEVVVHTIGMGTRQGGPIPIMQGRRQVGYKKDKEGSTVVTRLDEKMLQDISTTAGGEFVRASTASMGINLIMEEINSMNKAEFGTKTYAEYEDRFQVFLGIALVLLLLQMLIADRKNKWQDKLNLFDA